MSLRESAPVEELPLEPVVLPDPRPGPGEALVRVSVCGICRTDLHEVEGDLEARKRPVIPGHQVVGRIAAPGPGCERLREGDRVGIAWLRGTCGRCDRCRAGAGREPPVPMDAAIVFAPAGEVVPPALRALGPGGTCVIAGIHMSPIPGMTYEDHLFHEKSLRSVEANTREDGRRLLAEAAEVPVRPRTTAFALAEANDALLRLKRSEIEGTGVLAVGAGAP